MDIFKAIRDLLGGGQKPQQRPQPVQQPLNDSWDTNDNSALYAPDDPRSRQTWKPSGIETNASGVRQPYGPQRTAYLPKNRPTQPYEAPYAEQWSNPQGQGQRHLGVDPMMFGYPADNSAQPQVPNFEDILKGLRIRF